LYGLALLSFHLAQILFTVRRPIQGGHAVVCDRYIFDTMVDLHQDLHVPISRIRGIFGARWIPQPNCKVLLDLKEETAFGRKTDTASVDYLRNRRTMYLDIAREYGLTVVDAGQPIEAITRFLMEQIEPLRFRGEGTG
jgi:thymidylate kinase